MCGTLTLTLALTLTITPNYTQAIVFMCGPGNYLEYLSIREQVVGQQAYPNPNPNPYPYPNPNPNPNQVAGNPNAARNVLYGCAEMQTPSEFLAQVAQIPIT